MNRLVSPGRVAAMVAIMSLILAIYMYFLYDLQIIQGEEYYSLSERITSEETESRSEISGVVAELRFAVLEGTTRAYIRLEGEDCFYVVSVADSEIAAVLKEGDSVALRSAVQEGELRAAFDLRRD